MSVSSASQATFRPVCGNEIVIDALIFEKQKLTAKKCTKMKTARAAGRTDIPSKIMRVEIDVRNAHTFIDFTKIALVQGSKRFFNCQLQFTTTECHEMLP